MNAESLLARYARIADASDAITRLRRFVLDLAVRGKLVAQNPSEESASQLLASIAHARSAAGASDSFPPVSPDDQPFDLPIGWAWSRVGAVCSKTGSGCTPRGGQSAYKKRGIPFLRSQNIYNDGLRLDDVAFIDDETHLRMSGTAVHPADLLLNITGGSMGRCCRVPDQFDRANISQHVAIIRAAVGGISDFLHCLVLSPYFQSFIFGEQTGAGRGGLPKNRMDRIAIALPPLAEQHRIVAKVDELMALCDQLEAARAQREATRDRLGAASLARLNAPDPDTFRADARFALDALPALTTRPDQIKQLRQTILNLAVRGKLSPDGVWQREPRPLSMVASLQNGYAFKSEWFAAQGTRLLRNVNVGHGNIDWANQACLPSERALEYDRFRLRAGDLVLSLDRPFIATGTKVARVTAADLPALLLQRVGRFVLSNDITPQYLYLWINSPHFSAQINPGRSNGVPHISSKQVEATLLFLPPVSEQRRIVAKVDELMTLCDQLEASLTTGETTRSRLLDALLHEALATAQTESIEHPRAAVSAYVVSRLASKRNFGRTAHMKHLYLAESRLGLKLGGRYERQAAGPLDTGIYELEKQAEAAGWYTYNVEKLPSGKEKVSYVPGKALKALAEEGAAVLGPSRKEMDRLIDLMGGLKTEQVEIIATLFAAWNDALIDGFTPDDDWIMKEVREHWHISKRRFEPAELCKWLAWMRQHDVVPLGHPPRTMQQTSLGL